MQGIKQQVVGSNWTSWVSRRMSLRSRGEQDLCGGGYLYILVRGSATRAVNLARARYRDERILPVTLTGWAGLSGKDILYWAIAGRQRYERLGFSGYFLPLPRE